MNLWKKKAIGSNKKYALIFRNNLEIHYLLK